MAVDAYLRDLDPVANTKLVVVSGLVPMSV